jgi:hypothetical protein
MEFEFRMQIVDKFIGRRTGFDYFYCYANAVISK